jgi:hypothetical protein
MPVDQTKNANVFPAFLFGRMTKILRFLLPPIAGNPLRIMLSERRTKNLNDYPQKYH